MDCSMPILTQNRVYLLTTTPLVSVHMHDNLHHNILWYTEFTAKISSKEIITEPPQTIYLEDTTDTRYYSMLRLPTETYNWCLQVH
jgi:hypothetical protein